VSSGLATNYGHDWPSERICQNGILIFTAEPAKINQKSSTAAEIYKYFAIE
tara:strand:- start:1560 stop:1712 length:153 start_codon:yes stop_codon:yes gene_type:complete